MQGPEYRIEYPPSESLESMEYWTWYNEEGFVHRDDGPAMIEKWVYSRGGAVKTVLGWYQNGRMWRLDPDMPALINVYRGPAKSDEVKWWFKKPDVPLKKVEYGEKTMHDYGSNPSIYKSTSTWIINPDNDEEHLHSFDDNPCLVKYVDDTTGMSGPNHTQMEWRYMGRKHRQMGPAMIEMGGGNRREYWLKGTRFPDIDKWLAMTDLTKAEKVAIKLEQAAGL